MIKFDAKLNKSAFQHIDALPEAILKAIKHGVKAAMKYAKRSAQDVGFSGRPHLISGTHKLKNSIGYSVSDNGTDVVGSLFSDCIYAPTHEFGADIYPKTKKYLVFEGKYGKYRGKIYFLKKVHIKKRPFLAPALEKNADEIANIISETIYREVNK
jgi:phage gpG-like protein